MVSRAAPAIEVERKFRLPTKLSGLRAKILQQVIVGRFMCA
jgi:hypothetical protein